DGGGRDEERWVRPLGGPDYFGKHSRSELSRAVIDIKLHGHRASLRVERFAHALQHAGELRAWQSRDRKVYFRPWPDAAHLAFGAGEDEAQAGNLLKLQHRRSGRAARRPHQSARMRVPFGNDAVEWRGDAQVSLNILRGARGLAERAFVLFKGFQLRSGRL